MNTHRLISALVFSLYNEKYTQKYASGQRFFTDSNRYCCIIKGQAKRGFLYGKIQVNH